MRSCGVVVALVIAACSSSSSGPNREDCEKLRDHTIDVRLASIGTGSNAGDPGVDIAAHRAAMKQALGDSFVSSCLQTMTSTQIECALGAKDTETAVACATAPKNK